MATALEQHVLERGPDSKLLANNVKLNEAPDTYSCSTLDDDYEESFDAAADGRPKMGLYEIAGLVAKKTHMRTSLVADIMLRIKKLARDELNAKGVFRMASLCIMERKKEDQEV